MTNWYRALINFDNRVADGSFYPSDGGIRDIMLEKMGYQELVDTTFDLPSAHVVLEPKVTEPAVGSTRSKGKTSGKQDPAKQGTGPVVLDATGPEARSQDSTAD